MTQGVPCMESTSVRGPSVGAYPASWYDGGGRLMLKNLTFEQMADWVVAALGESACRLDPAIAL